MNIDEIEKIFEAFIGEEGDEKIHKAKVFISSLYNILEKARTTLDATSSFLDSIIHARNKMKEGYEATKSFITPGMASNFKDVYIFLKKFGIISALENMGKK